MADPKNRTLEYAKGSSTELSFDEDKQPKTRVGRPRIADSEKAVYQRVPIRYETYKKLKEITQDQNITFTDLIEAMLLESKLNTV